MMYDIQKASFWKRVSAWMFDMILLGIIIVGIAFSLSSGLGYDAYSQTMEQRYDYYETEYNTSFDITMEEYEALTPDAKQAYEDAYEALTKDESAMHAYSMMVNLSLAISSISILLAYIIMEFVFPMYFGNGQTLGKKIFGLGLIRPDGVRISTMQLFVRTVLGKYTIETMVPVLLVLMITFGAIGALGTLIILALLVTQLILLFATRNSSLLHDLLAGTVVVDLASQMIFATPEDRLAYIKDMAAEQSSRQTY